MLPLLRQSRTYKNMKLAVLLRDPDRVLLSTLAGEAPTGTDLMNIGIRKTLLPLLKLNNNSLGDSSVGVVPGGVGADEVSTLVSPSLNNTSPINDNYCVSPTPVQVNQVQLEPQSAIVFSRAQNVNKTLKLDVSCHAVTHAHIVPLHGLPQKKGLSPDQSMNKIKHVKGVCCVNPCLSVPPVPNVPNAVIKQSVGGRLQRFW